MSCPSCGFAAPSGARFCPECGTGLDAPGGRGSGAGEQRPDERDERRLVTVLMADLVGFTSLSEHADPEQVKNLVDRTFQRLVNDVHHYGGTLDKVVGDQLVASFGARVAHEDDAERAVRAALAMLDTLALARREEQVDLQLRVGINTGEVLVGALRVGGDSTVMGDVVNAANRLQTAAAPGQILVGPATFAASRHSVEFEPVGELTVRGRDEPIETWRAIAALRPPGRRQLLRGPIVGRDAELGALRLAIGLSFSRSRANSILLLGEGGVGKTRIATELANTANAEDGATVLIGHCVPYGDAKVWAPIADVLRHACGVESDDDLGTCRTKTITAVGRALGLPRAATETERVAEGLLYFLQGFTRPGVDPARARDDAMRAAATFLRAQSERAPLVIVLSDLHWGDDLLLELTDRLLQSLRNQRFVLLGTARPGIEERWSPKPGHHNTMVLHLDALDAQATRDLVRELLGAEADEAVVEFVLERSGGNPFFVEELVALVADAEEHDEGIGPIIERVRGLPATLHGIVAARLDALDTAERSLLEDLSVIGPTGQLADVEAICTGSGLDVPRLLGRLVDRGLIEVDDREFRFRSELVRDVAYGTLTKADRARHHAELAVRLSSAAPESERVAQHLAAAAELVAEIGTVAGVPDDIRGRAVGSLLAAADRMTQAENFVAAGALSERALALIPPDAIDQRWPALLGIARAHEARRELDVARDIALRVSEEARELGDGAAEAEALIVLGQAEFDAGALDAAEAAFHRSAAVARAGSQTAGVANALRWLGMVALFRGQDAEAERLLSDALESFRNLGDARGEAWALQNLAWISFSAGRIAEADRRLNESAERFGDVGDWGGLGWAIGMLAFVRFNQGNLDEAEQLAHQVLVEANELGHLWAASMMQVLLAHVALWRGHAEESIDLSRAALTRFREAGDAWAQVQATSPLARALNVLGRFSECREVLNEAQPAIASLADPNLREIGNVLVAAVALHRGDAASARAAVVGLTHLPSADGDNTPESVADADEAQLAAMTALQSGDPATAVAVLRRARERAHTEGARAAIGSALALALVTNGEPNDALDYADEVDRMRGGTYLDRLYASWARGFAHGQLGNAEAAVSAFEHAHGIAFGTESRLDRAISSLARSTAYSALAQAGANEAETESALTLHALGIDAPGWRRVFGDAALHFPSTQP